MPLLRLPPETLAQIFDEVGSSFFREDLGRLTVCKQWFEFALPALYSCVSLSQETLRRLMASGITARPCPISHSLKALYLQLEEDYPSVFDENPQDEPNMAWTEDLDKDLAKLAMITQQSGRLRTVLYGLGAPMIMGMNIFCYYPRFEAYSRRRT